MSYNTPTWMYVAWAIVMLLLCVREGYYVFAAVMATILVIVFAFLGLWSLFRDKHFRDIMRRDGTKSEI